MTIPQVSGYGNYLYPYQTYTPPQFNNWNNYGYSTPVFRGAESQPVMQQPLSRDTVELSAEKEIKNKQKEGLSTGAKWAIGLATSAAAVYGCVVGHRMLTKPSIEKVAKNFSEIFRRDVSKEEALKITERYKEIFKIKDKDEFIKKCFEQVKKDFGYGGLNVQVGKLPKELLETSRKEGNILCGGYRPLTPVFKEMGNGMCKLTALTSEILQVNPNQSRSKLFETIVHEITHLKQHEIAYRTDKKAFFEAIRKNRFLGLDRKYIQEYERAFEEVYGPILKNMPKITKGTKEYELGMKYIDGIEKYKSGSSGASYEEYISQLIEKEAHGTQPLANKIYEFFANPWRLF